MRIDYFVFSQRKDNSSTKMYYLGPDHYTQVNLNLCSV